MKLTNPFGREVAKASEGGNPRGCVCSSGSVNMKYYVGSCFLCGCQCDSGTVNRNANNSIANAKGAI